MSASFLYQWVLASPSGERMEAIQALNHESLCSLAGFLFKNHIAGETTGDVLGMCLVEQAKRFVASVCDRRILEDLGPANLANEEEQRRKVREVMG
jgi:hypothetical protein